MSVYTKEFLLNNIAPCGCLCYSCTGCAHGIIVQSSKTLLHYLDGYSSFLEKQDHKDKPLVDTCIRVLSYWSKLNCPGCRNDVSNQCTLENCFVRDCIKEKQLDFCADCENFPCDKAHESKAFMNTWLNASTRIREVGAEQFFSEEKEQSHFTRFKDEN